MTRLVLTLILLFTLVACEKATDQVTISKEEYQKLKGDTLQSEYPKPFKLHREGLSYYDDGIVLGSDKHEYLVINYAYNSCNVEHYIDCKLCKERSTIHRPY